MNQKDKFKPAKFIKKMEGWQGDAALYELYEPHEGHKKVVVSAVNVMFSGPETLIFPWDEAANAVTNFLEINGVYDRMSHKHALEKIGYYIEEDSKMLIKPVIHLNGSGKELLDKQYRGAYDALHKAIGALIEMSPHGRDYYNHSNPDAYAIACEQNRARINQLNMIQNEILELRQAIDNPTEP